jgi:exodeoxyribonuclease V alpha subunit
MAISTKENTIHRITGTVIDLHAKSGDNWSRAQLLTDEGTVWVTAKFRLEEGETVEVNATYNAKFRSYDVVEIVIPTDGQVSNSVIKMKLVEYVSGVGSVKAGRLAEQFPNLWETLKNNRQAIADACGASLASLDQLVAVLEGQQSALSRVSELIRVGYPNSLAKRIAQNDKQYVIAIKSPYEAIKYVFGLGWALADEIGHRMGIAKDDPVRIEAGVFHYWQTVVSNNGNTRAMAEEILDREELPSLLGLPASKIDLMKLLVPINTSDEGKWYTTDAALANASTIKEFFGI